MKTWVVVAAALVPLGLIGVTYVLPLAPGQANAILLYAAAGCGLATAGVTGLAQTQKPDLTKGFDAAGISRHGLLVGLSIALGADCLVLVVGANWLAAGVAGAALVAGWMAICLAPQTRAMVASCSIVINRDQGTVFAYMTDFRTIVDWYPGVQKVEMTTPPPIGRGSQFRSTANLPTGPATGVDEIVDYEPDHLCTSTTLGMMKNRDILTFEPEGSGTRVSLRAEVELSPWMTLVGAWLAKGSLARTTVSLRQAAWANAKRLLESRA